MKTQEQVCLQSSRPSMGSLLEIMLYGSDSDQRHAAMKAAFAEVQRLEALLSPFKPGSELTRINQSAASAPVNADPEVVFLIQQALYFAERSGGAFDPTIVPLVRLWGFRNVEDRGRPVRPTREEIRKTLRSVGYRNVSLGLDRSTVQYWTPGIEIEFGAIGKGYAVDRAAAVLRSHGISRALVSFGSSLYALGNSPSKPGWSIAIRHPRESGSVADRVFLKDCAIGTSGDYEQSVRIDGRDFGHVLDPRAGEPVSGMGSVSVIAPTALEADALSTAALVQGIPSGLKLLAGRAGVEGLFIEEKPDGGLGFFRTEGWERFRNNSGLSEGLTRRRFLAALAAGLAALLINPRLGFPVVYLTREEALRKLIPEAEEFEAETLSLTSSQRERVQALLDKKIQDERYPFWIAKKAGAPIGYAVVLEAIGKERPITFMIAVNPDGGVIGVEVLIYRESQGSEIRSGRFIRQFIDKTLSAPLKIGRDVDAISGASLSSRATAYAVKKALALTAVVYGKESGGSP